jgi:hypothetical protein
MASSSSCSVVLGTSASYHECDASSTTCASSVAIDDASRRSRARDLRQFGRPMSRARGDCAMPHGSSS